MIKLNQNTAKANKQNNLNYDKAQLKKLLKDKRACKDLESLFAMAWKASHECTDYDDYVSMTPAFCDGFEVNLGNV